MKNRFSCFFDVVSLVVLGLTLQTGVMASQTDNPSSVRLSGHVPASVVSDSVYLNKLDASTHVPVTFVLPLRNTEALEQFILRIYDPTDKEHYGKYLTPEEFSARFAPSQEDYDKLVDYAKSLGLTITGMHSNRTLLNIAGSSEAIETAFDLHLHQYQKPNGQIFYAPSENPQVPSSIASMIHGIVGLDNHAVRHTYNRQKPKTENILVSSDISHAYPSGPGGGYAPKDLLTAYNLAGLSANGSGQIIALFELGGYLASDIDEYAHYFGLPTPKLTIVKVDGGSTSGIDPEVTLDIELALALAPHSQIHVYQGPNSDQGVLVTYNRIAIDNRAKQVSTSWGMGENLQSPQSLKAESSIFQQMAAQGQTIFAAAGDSGAYDNYPSLTLVVDDPASQPYVTGVGGTRLSVNHTTGAYSNEVVWDDGEGNGAGGGGVSQFWTIPSWQKNVSTTYSKTHRNVPDVALNADPDTGYAIYYDNQWTIYGGTSCAAPLWAAFTACVNQVLTANQNPTLGFANPTFYTIGVGSLYTQNFHDITSGNNFYYSAKKGYDNASGWGSFNGADLFASLTHSTQSSPSQQTSPFLDIALSHKDPFQRGKGGTYTILVSNPSPVVSSEVVTVTINLPKGLSLKWLTGAGWTVDPITLICTQSSVLEPGASFPPISLFVSVDYNAPSLVGTSATVSGESFSSKTSTNLVSVK